MLKALSQFINKLSIALVVALMLFCFFFASLQTKWVKKQLIGQLMNAAKTEGVTLTIGSIEGRLPFQWTLRDVRVQFNPTDSFSFKSAKMRLAFFPLLRGEVTISYLTLRDPLLIYAKKTEAALPPLDLNAFELPLNLAIKNLKVPYLRIESPHSSEVVILNVQGRGKYKRKEDALSFSCKVIPLSAQESSLELTFQGNKAKNSAETEMQIKHFSSKMLETFVTLPFETELNARAMLKGEWNSLAALFAQKGNASLKALQGAMRCNVLKFAYPNLPMLNRKWSFESSFWLSTERALDVKKFFITSNLASIDAKGKTDVHGELKEGYATFKVAELGLLSDGQIKGTVSGEALYNGKLSEVHFQAENIAAAGQTYPSTQGTLSAAFKEKTWRGELHFNAEHTALPFSLQSRFVLHPNASLDIQDLLVTGPEAQITGHLEMNFKPRSFNGALFAQAMQLHIFESFFPGSRLSGKLGAEIHFTPKSASLNFTGRNLRYFQMTAEELAVSGEIVDIFAEPKGNFSIEAEKACFDKVEFSSLVFKADSEKEAWPFHLQAKGAWEGHLEVEARGEWSRDKETIHLNLNEFSGIALRKPFTLEKSVSIRWSPEQLFVSDCAMSIADGSLFFNLDLSRTLSKALVKAEHFPIDLITVAYPTLTLNGLSSWEAFVEATEQNIQGRLNLLLEGADVYQFGKTEPLKAKGTLQANLDKNRLQIHTDIRAIGDQQFDCSASLPIAYTLFPFKLKIDQDKPLAGEMVIEGRLEEIFDFINLGSHRTEGQLSCRLFLSKTWANPSLNGKLELEDGVYENYYTGTLLKEIYAELDAENSALKIKTMRAKDDQGGTVTASGLVKMEKKFPYAIEADVNNLNFLRFDAFTANFTGPVRVDGDTQAALASGTLKVSKARIDIPDEMPIELPVLNLTYVNQPENIEVPSIETPKIFPFRYDLQLSATQKVYVHGRGLNSEWQGNMHLTGTNAIFALDGTLTLLRGEYAFAGKVFSLNEGEITFVDRASQTAHLNLKGTLTLPELTVVAILNGPLTSPKLTFQSSPQMPTSSILAHILFNKDVSDINPIQALQLAQMLVSISGGMGPDVLEKIRRSLGVDRINIVSSKSGLDDSEAVAVQIGKYLTRGVMVTLSQSADSTNVIVEVELKHGFLLQAETQEEQQGKFSLKWNRNY